MDDRDSKYDGKSIWAEGYQMRLTISRLFSTNLDTHIIQWAGRLACMKTPDEAFHIQTEKSSLPAKMMSPFGCQLSHSMPSVGPSKVCRHWPLLVDQILTWPATHHCLSCMWNVNVYYANSNCVLETKQDKSYHQGLRLRANCLGD